MNRAIFAAIALTLVTAAVAVGCGGNAASSTTPEPRPATVAADRTMAKLERIVRERVDRGRGGGIVAGVVFPDGRARVFAYGKAGSGKPLDSKSVFEIGSITKVFTSTLLAEMAQRGEVSLDDRVARFLPKTVAVPARGGRQITLVDLATQTSGLPRLPTNLRPANPANPYADYTPEKLYDFLSSYTLTRDIGSKFEYSNLGVGLLGHVLARQAGKSYDAVLREHVLEPLGMTMTGSTLTPEMKRHFAAGHDERGRVVAPWDLPTLAGAGALRSNITDMLEFAAANLEDGGGSLQRATAATHVPRQTIDPQTRIGLNWFVVRPYDREIVWHDGGTGGFSSFIGLDKARHRAVVVLSNSAAANPNDIGLHVLDERLPLAPAPKVRKAITLPAKVLERYVGVYQLPGLRLTITRTPQGLVVKAPGQAAERLYAETETEFFVKDLDVQVIFQRDSKSAVTGLVLRAAGMETAAKKIK